MNIPKKCTCGKDMSSLPWYSEPVWKYSHEAMFGYPILAHGALGQTLLYIRYGLYLLVFSDKSGLFLNKDNFFYPEDAYVLKSGGNTVICAIANRLMSDPNPELSILYAISKDCKYEETDVMMYSGFEYFKNLHQ